MRCLSMTARGLRCEQEFTEPAWFVPPASNEQVIGDLCDAAERFWLKNGRRSVAFGLDLRGVSLLPDTTIGARARLTRCVVDSDCDIPPGMVVGEDPEEDARRFRHTENGVTLITRKMLERLN